MVYDLPTYVRAVYSHTYVATYDLAIYDLRLVGSAQYHAVARSVSVDRIVFLARAERMYVHM